MRHRDDHSSQDWPRYSGRSATVATRKEPMAVLAWRHSASQLNGHSLLGDMHRTSRQTAHNPPRQSVMSKAQQAAAMMNSRHILLISLNTLLVAFLSQDVSLNIVIHNVTPWANSAISRTP